MPRQVPIARLTVDRPQFTNKRREDVATWLECRAEEIESEPNLYSLSGFRARIFSPYNTNGRCPWAELRINAAGCLSLATRKRIAKWLRSRAKWVLRHGAGHDRRWFTQEFSL